MPTGSGIDAQLGLAPETTYGVLATPTRFLEFNSESLKQEPTWLEPTGIRPGLKFKRASRARVSRRNVTGDVALDIATKGMGALWRQALGSPLAAPVLITAGAYRQPHVPGDFLGRSMTMQVGRPEPATGTVRPHTYRGCKVAGWEFSCTDGEIPNLTLSISGRDETVATALASASYLSGSSVFDFSQSSLKFAGTVTTAGGLTTISGDSAVAFVIRSIKIKGETPMATERFGLGNAGLKNQPLENGVPMITGTLEAEFDSATYASFVNVDTLAMHFTLTGGTIGATASNYLLDFIMPAVKFKAAAPAVSGPDIVPMSIDFEAYNNEVDPTIQVLTQSDEATF